MNSFVLALLVFTAVLLFRGGDTFLLGDSCANRCNSGLNTGEDFSCQCNQQCVNFNDCCDDYQTQCLASSNSCQGRCHSTVSTGYTCQCNSHCVRFNDCCSDYNTLCVDTTTTPSSGTCKTMAQMGQALWDDDVNRLSSSDVTINYQTKVQDGTSTDNSPSSLFTHVDESKLTSPTFSAFIDLLDNYNPTQTSTEHASSHETTEVYAFLDAVLDTKVMTTLKDFLICQSKVTSKADLRSKLKTIWFDFYQRSSRYGYHSTSGFEHILAGEYKDSSTVSGFHSWLSFYKKEKAGTINYLGYVSKKTPDVLGAAFTWNGRLKTKGTFLVGTSPELDLAIYTLCYLMFPNSVCNLTLEGQTLGIQTYDSNGHIATAYIR